jgi:hypothetical protein
MYQIGSYLQETEAKCHYYVRNCASLLPIANLYNTEYLH